MGEAGTIVSPPRMWGDALSWPVCLASAEDRTLCYWGRPGADCGTPIRLCALLPRNGDGRCDLLAGMLGWEGRTTH